MDPTPEQNGQPASETTNETSSGNTSESGQLYEGYRSLFPQNEPSEANSVPPGGASGVAGGNEKAPSGSGKNSRAGRKPLLDEAKRRDICTILALGGTRRMAAYRVGCSLDTIVRTARRDPAFAGEICKAEADSEILFLRTLKTKHWRAAAWALERLFPHRYGRRAPDTITEDEFNDVLRHLGQDLRKDIPEALPTPERLRADAKLRALLRAAKRFAPFKKRAAKSKIDGQNRWNPSGNNGRPPRRSPF